jgi:hypothetical protein
LKWPDVAFDPYAVFQDPAPAYLRGVMPTYLPDGSVRRGSEVISSRAADAIEAEPVVPDVDDDEAA